MELKISIEICGEEYDVGSITGDGAQNAQFQYDEEYLSNGAGFPISISLPFQKEAFTQEKTRNFFEGLLPEGFTRRTVAQWIHAEEGDYLRILSALGKECLGALKVTDFSDINRIKDERCYEPITMEEVRTLAREGASKSAELVTKTHLSLTGASGKVGLYYDEKGKEWYLPKGTSPSTHIVKQSHVRLDGIVVNEQLTMLTAKRLGIDVPDSFIIHTGSFEDSGILFATRRYDRIFKEGNRRENGLLIPWRIHQEDFAQALGIPAVSKYEKEGEHHMREAFNLVRRYSANPLEDQIKLWERIIFNFLIGNTDAHLKNFSLLYDFSHGTGKTKIVLAPAYDMISTTIYKESTRDMAFRIGGIHSIDEINRGIFEEAAKEVGIGSQMAIKILDSMAEKFANALEISCDETKACGFENAEKIKKRILETGGYAGLG